MWSPLDYQQAAVLAQEAAEELQSRLSWLTCQPKVIVDMGCGPGDWSAKLQAQYPQATLIGIDTSSAMLQQAKQQDFLRCIEADAGQLPLRAQSVDLIFANLLLPWCQDMLAMLKEWRRVLRPDGVLLITAFGPDTLREWRDVIGDQVLVNCIDIHDIGDALLQAGFAEPVLDVNYYTITYRALSKLSQELQASGMILNTDFPTQHDTALTPEGTWAVTGEIVFAHAFAPSAKPEVGASADGIVRIPLSHLRRA